MCCNPQTLTLITIYNIPDGELHYNSPNLFEVFKIISIEWNNSLYGNREKYRLIWQQVTAYVMQGLPACDRQAFGGTFTNLLLEHRPNSSSFKSGSSFLGKFASKTIPAHWFNSHVIDILELNAEKIAPLLAFDKHDPSFYCVLYSTVCLLKNKNFKLIEVIPHSTSSWCVVS